MSIAAVRQQARNGGLDTSSVSGVIRNLRTMIESILYRRFSGRYGALRIFSRTKLSGAAPRNSVW